MVDAAPEFDNPYRPFLGGAVGCAAVGFRLEFVSRTVETPTDRAAEDAVVMDGRFCDLDFSCGFVFVLVLVLLACASSSNRSINRVVWFCNGFGFNLRTPLWVPFASCPGTPAPENDRPTTCLGCNFVRGRLNFGVWAAYEGLGLGLDLGAMRDRWLFRGLGTGRCSFRAFKTPFGTASRVGGEIMVLCVFRPK